MTHARRRGAHERGNTLPEFAIVLTAALMLMMGVIDFGRGLYTYHLLSNAARMGTRYAIVHGSACSLASCPASATDIQTYVRGLTGELNTAAVTVDTNWTTSTGCSGTPFKGPGCLVSVSVSYPFRFVAVPLLPAFTMTLASASQMTISQ